MKMDQLRFLSVDDLLILVYLAKDHLSVTDVAARLKLTQPAITQRIRKMEEAFGNKIIERKGRGIELTRFGLEKAVRATAAMAALHGEPINGEDFPRVKRLQDGDDEEDVLIRASAG